MRREKMYRLDDHVACAIAGLPSDANILVNAARLAAQRHTLTYQEPVPVEQLVRALCDTKHGYTQFGGMRPFGVSLLYAGWDASKGFQLYQSDPSGNYGGWKAASVGANHAAATTALQADYAEGLDAAAAVKLAVKVLSKAMDSTALSPDKVELATLTRDAAGRVEFRVFEEAELKPLLDAVNAEQVAAKAREQAAAS